MILSRSHYRGPIRSSLLAMNDFAFGSFSPMTISLAKHTTTRFLRHLLHFIVRRLQLVPDLDSESTSTCFCM